MGDFRMPSLGADMDHATLVAWRVAPGTAVKRGDIIAEVETEKGNVEVEVFDTGVVRELLAPPGTRVRVGTVMARIGNGDGPSPGAPVAAVPPVAAVASAPPSAPSPALAPRPAAAASAAAPVVRATPAARRLARERAIDLATLSGTGPEGAITMADVERAPAGPPPPPPPSPHRVSPAARREAEALGIDVAPLVGSGERGVVTKRDVEAAASRAAPPPAAPAPTSAPAAPASPLDQRAAAMRRAVAAAMTRSNREIPHYYLATDVDLTRAMSWLDAANRARPVTDRLLPAVLLLKAIALALREVPELNGAWVDEAFRPGAGIHPGVAISLRTGGLVAPAIHDADTLAMDALMQALRDLVQRARSGMLRSSELTDATITVTNLGDLGVRTVFGVVYPPQVALVGVGRITERPWAEHGMLDVRSAVTVTLAADHRATDGHRGGQLLTTIDRLLQTPEKL